MAKTKKNIGIPYGYNGRNEPSPFHKKGKSAGDHKKSFLGIPYGGKWTEDDAPDQAKKIKGTSGALDEALEGYRDLQGTAGENLYAGARNMMNIGDNFGGIQTDFENAYGGISNAFSGLSNQYAGMENTMEDLTVNQQQAQFEKEMAGQQQADTMSKFAGAAGGSGIAGLAQAMSGAQSQQRQAASASIGQQEAANQMAAAKAGMDIQQQVAAGASAVDMAKAKGDEARQMAIAGGAQSAAELGSSAELAQAEGKQGAQIARGQGAMEAQKIRLQGAADARDLQFQAKQGELSFLAGMLGAQEANAADAKAKKSDRKLKKNITKIGKSPSGLNIYSFEYKNLADGDGLFQGVMSDEIPQQAVINNGKYDTVDYSMLDVEFKQI